MIKRDEWRAKFIQKLLTWSERYHGVREDFNVHEKIRFLKKLLKNT